MASLHWERSSLIISSGSQAALGPAERNRISATLSESCLLISIIRWYDMVLLLPERCRSHRLRRPASLGKRYDTERLGHRRHRAHDLAQRYVDDRNRVIQAVRDQKQLAVACKGVVSGVIARADRNRIELNRLVWVGQVEDGNETRFSDDVRRTIQSPDLDKYGFAIGRRHRVLQRRAFVRLARDRCPTGRLAIEYGQLRSNFFGDGVNNGQLADLTKRSVGPLIHFSRAALRHHHEATAAHVLDRGPAAAGRLHQLNRGNVGVDVEDGNLTGSGEEMINPAGGGGGAGPVRRQHHAGFAGLVVRLKRSRAVITEVSRRKRLNEFDVGR